MNLIKLHNMKTDNNRTIDLNKHTPLPWAKDYGATKGHIKSISNFKDYTPTVARYSGRSNIEICGSLPEEEREANAELIVKAVNNFQAMKTELERLYEKHGSASTKQLLEQLK